MYYRDHQPPHFHAVYAEYEVEIGVDPIMILDGNLPRPERTKALAWAALHQAELRANWELARGGRRLLPIEPLD